MRHCIPDELMNSVRYPNEGLEAEGIGRIFQEIRYKVPYATDGLVRKEVWHTVCDLCTRLGALVDHKSATGTEVELKSQYGRFIRVVGAKADGAWLSGGFIVTENENRDAYKAEFVSSGKHDVYFSVQPSFSDTGTNAVSDGFDPNVPRWFVDRYGECVAHGALMRIFAMSAQPWADVGLARMHAISYNNDMTRFSFGLITSGMRKHLLVDVEDMVLAGSVVNGNG